MKKTIFLLSFLFLFSITSLSPIITIAQNTITAQDAANFIGKEATVCGNVASAKFASRTKGQPTFLNLDKPYPRQVFTVLIWGSDRGKFETPPETLSGKEICVSGVIQSYKGAPEIIVKDPLQIKVK